jgi:ribosomal protein S18 acetylase RimI-like enzyme
MNITFLPWDSDFFGIKVAKAEASPGVLLRRSDLDLSANDLYYVFSSVRQPLLEEEGALLADAKVTYSKQLPDIAPVMPDAVIPFSGEVNEELFALGISSGWSSRFNLDPKLNYKFEELYRLWVSNSVSGKIADIVYVIRDGEKFIGLMTLKQDGSKGKIGIIAVDPGYRGKAYGAALLKAADHWYIQNNISTAEVVTQEANEGACKFYESNGYHIYNIQYIYHVWR